MINEFPPVSYPGATLPVMTTRLALSFLCLCALLGALFLILWGMSADYLCSGTGANMSCHWSHSLVPGAHAPSTSTHQVNR